MTRLPFHSVFLKLVLLMYVTILFTSSAQAQFSPKAFERSGSMFFVTPQHISVLSTETRSAHFLYRVEDETFNLKDVIQDGDLLWATNNAGALICVNMLTRTVDELSKGRIPEGGKLAMDRRFVWVATSDSLYRMEITSKEWLSFPMNTSRLQIQGAISFNDQIHIISSKATHIFRPGMEDWAMIPHPEFTLKSNDNLIYRNAVFFTEDSSFLRYDPATRQWFRNKLNNKVVGTYLEWDNLTLATSSRLYQFDFRTNLLEPKPPTPLLKNVRAVTSSGQSIVGAIDKGLLFYYSPFDLDLVRYPEDYSPEQTTNLFRMNQYLILQNDQFLLLYDAAHKLWTRVSVQLRDRDPQGQYAWSQNGTFTRLPADHLSSLQGTFTAKQLPQATYDGPGSLETVKGKFNANGTLNLHTTDQSGRFLDLYADNSPATYPPQKGFYYKGATGDILTNAKFGFHNSGWNNSPLAPQVFSEGIEARAGSQRTTEGRDRSLISANVGSGYALSRTEWASFNYAVNGLYYLNIPVDRSVLPSSIRLFVDGSELPGTDFVFLPQSNAVQILRKEKTDPTSHIQISYSAKILPDNPSAVELTPAKHFGKTDFAEMTVSPRSWLSAHTGFINTEGESGPILHTGTAIEWRDYERDRMFQFTPDFAYDSKLGGYAANASWYGRQDKFFGSYKGQYISRDFNSTDKLAFADEKLEGEHEISAGYNVSDILRAAYTQSNRITSGSSTSHYEVSGSLAGDLLPDIDLSLSSNQFEIDDGFDVQNKSVLKLRLSDPASRFLQDKTGAYNFGYDFAFTDYYADDDRNGRIIYGSGSISPLPSLSFTGVGTYRSNPDDSYLAREKSPAVIITARDLPRGIDAQAGYMTSLYEMSDGKSTMGVQRNISSFIRPGEYVEILQMATLYLAYSQILESNIPADVSPFESAIRANEYTSRRTTVEGGGLILTPIDNLFLSTLNQRIREHETPTYQSFNHAKLWLENRSKVEGYLEMQKHLKWWYIHGSSNYEHYWNSSFLTGTGVFMTRSSEGPALYLIGGPQLSASYSKVLGRGIRLENSHFLRLFAEKQSAPYTSGLIYNIYLRLKFPREISLLCELNTSMREPRIAEASGGMYINAAF